jgi:ribosomal protein L34E
MPLTTRKRPRIGDVIEIPTPEGFAYAHYTHRHETPPRFGALIRVLPGLYTERPVDFAALVRQRPQFITFFPVGAACNRGITSVVASEPVGGDAAVFPTFRGAHRDRSGRQVLPWFLWDGRTTKRVEHDLTPEEMREYPPKEVINDTLLIERIISGWRHEDDRP